VVEIAAGNVMPGVQGGLTTVTLNERFGATASCCGTAFAEIVRSADVCKRLKSEVKTWIARLGEV